MHPETSSGIKVCLKAAGHVDPFHGLPTPTVPPSMHVPRGLLAYSLTNDWILLATLKSRKFHPVYSFFEHRELRKSRAERSALGIEIGSLTVSGRL